MAQPLLLPDRYEILSYLGKSATLVRGNWLIPWGTSLHLGNAIISGGTCSSILRMLFIHEFLEGWNWTLGRW